MVETARFTELEAYLRSSGLMATFIFPMSGERAKILMSLANLVTLITFDPDWTAVGVGEVRLIRGPWLFGYEKFGRNP